MIRFKRGIKIRQALSEGNTIYTNTLTYEMKGEHLMCMGGSSRWIRSASTLVTFPLKEFTLIKGGANEGN